METTAGIAARATWLSVERCWCTSWLRASSHTRLAP